MFQYRVAAWLYIPARLFLFSRFHIFVSFSLYRLEVRREIFAIKNLKQVKMKFRKIKAFNTMDHYASTEAIQLEISLEMATL